MQYLSIDTYNGTNTTYPLSFNSDRNVGFLDRTESYSLCIVKYNINNESIPIFIPNIISSIVPPVSKNGYVNMDCTLYNSYSPIYTDMCVSICFAGKTYYRNINWAQFGDSFNNIPNVSFQTFSNDNPFYHFYNTTDLCRLISMNINELFKAVYADNNAFVNVTNDITLTEIFKVNGYYTLLLHNVVAMFLAQNMNNPELNFTINFNGSLKRMFGFVYKDSSFCDHHAIDLSKIIFAVPFNETYVMISATKKLTNGIFPFVKLQIISGSDLIVPLNTQGSDSDKSMTSKKVITEYDLNIDDEDNFYNQINYISPNFDRKIRMKDTDGLQYNFTVSLLHKNGSSFTVNATPLTNSHIYLAFIPE